MGSSEMPLNGRTIIIAIEFPCPKLCSKIVNVLNTSSKTLTGHDVKFDFSNIEPTTMLWSIVEISKRLSNRLASDG